MLDQKEHERILVREIAGRVSAIKKDKGISQGDFTKIVTQQRFSSWNVKGAEPGVLKIHEIAKLLNVSMDFLVTGEDQSGISQDERTILDSFRKLNDEGKDNAILLVAALEKKYPLPSEMAGVSSKTAT
jgi:transcriptional regulator with XRE-family HTH domain